MTADRRFCANCDHYKISGSDARYCGILYQDVQNAHPFVFQVWWTCKDMVPATCPFLLEQTMSNDAQSENL